MRALVHFNLRTHLWSITDPKTRRVIDHRDRLVLQDMSFKVSAAGVERVRLRQRRTVIAWAVGVLDEYFAPPEEALSFSFNPFRSPLFTHPDGRVCLAGGTGYFGLAGAASILYPPTAQETAHVA